ncbi:MAG TPA: ABC transporter permease [Vicinamibacterales bacterium]|nr:ABC transporter permease [Vicinamibacterales bacterium]
MGSGFGLDLRSAARELLGSPLISIPAVLTLAVAIGANTAVFSVVNALLLRPLPVSAPERLVTISSDFATSRGFRAGGGWSYAMWEAFRQRTGLFGGSLAWHARRFTLGASGETEPVSGLYVSGEFFTTLGVRPIEGRLFTVADDRPGSEVAVVVSDRLWKRRFGGGSGIIGSPLVVDGIAATVVGVTPPSFHGLEVGQPFDIALPLATESTISGRNSGLLNPRSFVLLVMLRLKAGQTLADATRTLRSLQPEILPANAPAFVGEPFTLVPAAGGTSGPSSAQQVYRRPLLMMLAWVALVLVIACVNIANLLLARAVTRQRELGVRVALGASRWRLARPLFMESLLLAVIGGIIGLLSAAWGARAIVALSPFVLDPVLDARVAAFTAAVVLSTVLLSGMAPVYSAARLRGTASFRSPAEIGGSVQRRLSGALVVLQISLALVLAITAGLFVRTFGHLAGVPLGFDAARVLVISVNATRSRVAPEGRLDSYQRLTDAVEGVPGVAGAAASMWTPLSGAGAMRGIKVPGDSGGSEVSVLTNFVTPGWFSVYGTPLRAGRDFTRHDGPSAPPVVIVNEAFERRFIAQGNAVGRTTPDGQLIVGVARDAVYRSSQRFPGVTSLALREVVPPTIYTPLAQLSLRETPPGAGIRISARASAGRPGALAPAIRAVITATDPTLTFEFRPLSEYVSSALAQERLSAAVSVCFGVLSLILATLGLYGVTSYAASRRAPEIGVRMALGAGSAHVVRLILGRALTTIALGIAFGLAGAVFVTRLLSSMLFGITPLDPLTVAGMSLLLATTGAIAALVPALRAARTDPWATLRSQ